MRRALEWFGIGLASLLLIVLLGVAVVYGVNLRDEPLTSQTQALLQLPPDPWQPADNIYLAIAGFDAPSGASVVTTGQARIERYNSRPDPLPLRPTSAPAPQAKEPGRLAFKGDISFCEPLVGSVWNEMSPRSAEIEKLRAENAELLQRYLALHRQHGYYETARADTGTPMYAVPAEVRKLFLADLALRLRSPSPREQHQALMDLEDDVRLWIASVYGREFLMQVSLLRRTSVSGSRLFKVQASENLFAAIAGRLMASAAADPSSLDRRLHPMRDMRGPWTLGLIYNPVGKMLAAVAEPTYDNYPPRAWDAAALQRMVRASYEIRRQRIVPAEVGTFLAQHPQWSTHPADGRAFVWDAPAGELTVRTLARQRPGRRFTVRIWQAGSAG